MLAGCAENAVVDPPPPALGANLSWEGASPLLAEARAPESLSVRVSPSASYHVRFGLLGDSLDAWLSATETYTSETGEGTVILSAPSLPTTFRVVATLDDGTGASLDVVVTESATGSVQVAPKYSGQREVTDWDATVVVGGTCAALLTEGAPPGALHATSDATASPVVAGVPLGSAFAVAARWGSAVWGCEEFEGLTADVSTVTVSVADQPLDLIEAQFGVACELDPVASGEFVSAAGAALLEALFPRGLPPATRLLDAMVALAPDPQALQVVRTANAWDSALDLSSTTAELAARVANGDALDLEATLGPVDPSVSATSFQVSRFLGAESSSIVPPSQLASLVLGPSDALVFGQQLLWSPIAWAAARVEQSAAGPWADQVGKLFHCSDVPLLVPANAVCAGDCLAELCATAALSLWSNAGNQPLPLVATLAGASTGVASVSVDAKVEQFEGEWAVEAEWTNEHHVLLGWCSAVAGAP